MVAVGVVVVVVVVVVGIIEVISRSRRSRKSSSSISNIGILAASWLAVRVVACCDHGDSDRSVEASRGTPARENSEPQRIRQKVRPLAESVASSQRPSWGSQRTRWPLAAVPSPGKLPEKVGIGVARGQDTQIESWQHVVERS